jgi:putative colanic acid biosynthesis UDP-glucose lipid carrier transferase
MNLLYSSNTKTESLHETRKDLEKGLSNFSASTFLDHQQLTYENKKIFRFTCLVIDFLAINTVNCVLGYFMKDPVSSFYNQLFFMLTNIFWIVSSYLNALYFAPGRFHHRSFYSFILYFLLLISFMFLFGNSYPREIVIFHLIGAGLIFIFTRSLFLARQEFIRKKAKPQKIIIIGYSRLSRQLRGNLESDGNYKVIGYFDDDVNGSGQVLGSVAESLSYAIEAGIKEIYCALSPEKNPDIHRMVQLADQHFIRLKFLPDLDHFLDKKYHINICRNIPIIALHSEPLEQFENRYRKRVFDIIFSVLVFTFLLSWLFPLIALLINLSQRPNFIQATPFR